MRSLAVANMLAGALVASMGHVLLAAISVAVAVGLLWRART